MLHFSREQLPPVDAFWSLTMYDADGYQVPNPIIASPSATATPSNTTPTARPGVERQANWLPSPASGALGITMRLYAPRAEIFDGRWEPPPLRRED